jgi:hypothetical protein
MSLDISLQQKENTEMTWEGVKVKGMAHWHLLSVIVWKLRRARSGAEGLPSAESPRD